MLYSLILNIIFVICFFVVLSRVLTKKHEGGSGKILIIIFGLVIIVTWATLFVTAGKHGLL